MTHSPSRAAEPAHERIDGMHGAPLTRREFVAAAGTAAAMTLAETAAAGKESPMAKRPNILMITVHDLGQHLGCYGVESVNSPNLDRLAARGIRFENYFAAAAVCSPSRGCMMTGRYPQSNGLMGLTHAPWWWQYNDGERHLAAILADAGYETTLVGLQHVTQGDPRRLGYRNILSKQCKAEESVEAARKFLAKAKRSARPFFLKVGFFEVHRAGGDYSHREPDTSKGLVIPPYLKDTPEIRDDLARFQADIRALDAHVGEILKALQASEVADDTLVIFTVDHGIAYPGAKWSLREPGLRIALILHQPGTALEGGKVVTHLASNVDFLPTLLDLAGVPIPKNVQGVSFKDVITGKTDRPPRRYVFAQRVSHALRDDTSRSIRTARYKLVRYFEPGRCVVYPTDAVPARVSRHTERPTRRGTRPFVQLFDLKEDPNEFNDIARDPARADIVRDLSQRLWAWMEEVGDPILEGPLVTPYYTAAMEDFRKFAPGTRTGL